MVDREFLIKLNELKGEKSFWVSKFLIRLENVKNVLKLSQFQGLTRERNFIHQLRSNYEKHKNYG